MTEEFKLESQRVIDRLINLNADSFIPRPVKVINMLLIKLIKERIND